MKISWGKGIVIAMSLFIGFIVSLSVILMTRQIDLDSEDYYKKEINYQEEINQLNNMNKLAVSPEVVVKNNMLNILLPDKLPIEHAEIVLSRPDNSNLDQKFPIEGTQFFSIPLEKLVKGKYNYELKFEANKTSYLRKGEIYF
jgi:hypothetical protein